MTERQSNHPTGIDPDRYFFSCDWGTTSFRLRLVETDTLRVAGELKNNEGIAATFQLWLGTKKPASERLAFYRSILETQIAALQASLKDSGGSSLSGIPLLISGMASSSIGMQELPYKDLPFNTNGEDLQMAIFDATSLHPHPTLLLSGVRSTDDVMRGEETQLIGCFPLHPPEQAHSDKSQGGGERLFIFPGTHSKHVRVRGNQVVGLRTYMTGEYFHLLTKHSILAASVAESIPPAGSIAPAGISHPTGSTSSSASSSARNPFEQGVLDSIDTNLLHQSFQVRTHHLLGTMSKEDNYHYLSGLLIGSECKDLAGTGLPLTLVSGDALQDQYTRALRTLGITDIELQPLDQAVIRAHARLRKSFLGK